MNLNAELKMTWAEESYKAGTLAEDLEEILASFEQYQVMLTQFMNRFEDEVNA